MVLLTGDVPLEALALAFHGSLAEAASAAPFVVINLFFSLSLASGQPSDDIRHRGAVIAMSLHHSPRPCLPASLFRLEAGQSQLCEPGPVKPPLAHGMRWDGMGWDGMAWHCIALHCIAWHCIASLRCAIYACPAATNAMRTSPSRSIRTCMRPSSSPPVASLKTRATD